MKLPKLIPTFVLVLMALAIILYAVNRTIIHMVHARVYERNLEFLDDSRGEVTDSFKRQPAAAGDDFAPLDKPRPFEKVNAFDEDAWCWSNQFSQYGAAGVLAFDANGDDRLDLYFSQDSQNWTRPTDDYGVLKGEPRFQHNGLYLNQGNDANGIPIFKPIHELAAANDSQVAEELIVEDYLYPRRRITDPTKERYGRGSNVAVAADFNNDGRLDLLVGNEPQGMFWSDPKTQRVLMRFVNPVGREDKKSKLPLAAMGLHLIKYKPVQGIHRTRKSARGIEPEGANSLYLNLGDKDGDGVPEWRDASRETGIEGFRCAYSMAVADIDRDGDLDVFVANMCDMDYWPGGSKYWAGGSNCMYVNQLAETGSLRFIERGSEMDIDGVYDEDYPIPHYWRLRRLPFLPTEYSIAFMKFERYQPNYLAINGEEAEHGQLSWSSLFQDVNFDGFPDIWVANDMGYLRLYLNDQGKRFIRSEHARSSRSGYWMTFAPGDFNSDLKEDLFVGNLGGAVLNHAFVTPDPNDLFDPVFLNSCIFAQFFHDGHDTRHGLIDGADFMEEMPNRVFHSRVLPPDISLPHNYRRHAPEDWKLTPFDPDTINAYEFSWGSTTLDVQNDGRLDLYYVGCLYGRGGGLFPISGTGPGRLLVNATMAGGDVRFVDQTAEHHLFNIEELKYDRLESRGYIYRQAPRQNWRKKDMLYSYDRSNWVLQGPRIAEKVTNQDMIQTAENGRATIAADFNNDGFADIVVRNQGGYDSRSSKSTNLQTMIAGRAHVLPAHNVNYPSPTNYEPGRTWLFVNRHSGNNWLKVRLLDDSPGSYNRSAIGAVVTVNGRLLRVHRCGNGGFLSNVTADLLMGLGSESARDMEIRWPDRDRTVTKVALAAVANRTVVVSKSAGLVEVR